MDPAASEFIARFGALSRTTHLAHLAATNSPASATLAGITEEEWGYLKSYLASVAANFGDEIYTGMEASADPSIALVTGMVQVRRWVQRLPGMGVWHFGRGGSVTGAACSTPAVARPI